MTDNDLIPDDERVEGHAEPDELAEASEIPEEVPEADAIEQAQDAEFEDDDDWR